MKSNSIPKSANFKFKPVIRISFSFNIMGDKLLLNFGAKFQR